MKEANDTDRECDSLGTLTCHDVDPQAAERIRALAHSILASHRERARQSAGCAHFYSRFVEPTLVSCITVLYLSWAVSQALLLYGIHP